MNDNILYMISEIPLPIIFLIVGIFMWKYPPKMNENIGYRTRRSRLSEEAWNTAQIQYGKYSTIIFAIMLAATVTAGIILVFKNPDEDTAFVLFMIITLVQIIVLFGVIAKVEHDLKVLYDENGKPKQDQ